MAALTTTDIEQLRDDILNKLVPSSRIRREELLHLKKITSQDFDDIGSKESALIDIADQLNRQVTVQILTDIEEPRQQIQTAINNIGDALEKIDKVNQFFAKLAVAFDILDTLVSAVGTPNPAVAISGILNKLKV